MGTRWRHSLAAESFCKHLASWRRVGAVRCWSIGKGSFNAGGGDCKRRRDCRGDRAGIAEDKSAIPTCFVLRAGRLEEIAGRLVPTARREMDGDLVEATFYRSISE